MRGYFGIGIECVSKSMNIGGLFRSAHAFGSSFVFTVNAQYEVQDGNKVDTSGTIDHVPFYRFPNSNNLVLPKHCKLVGIELLDDAENLPSFHHPIQAAYILGPERGSLSSTTLERCSYIVKIPTKFCINVGLAGAIIMYDRMISLGKFSHRPVGEGGPIETLPKHKFGDPILRKKLAQFQRPTPFAELEEYLKVVDNK